MKLGKNEKPPWTKRAYKLKRGRCVLCRRFRATLLPHHVTYEPEHIVWVCNFCHWVIHRPLDVLDLFKRVIAAYKAQYGELPVKPDAQSKEILDKLDQSLLLSEK